MNPKCGRKQQPVNSDRGSQRADRQSHFRGLLDRHLNSKNLNHSESRENVLELALMEKEHFSVQDLVRRAARKYPQLGAATIYRAVPVLLDAGILRETLSLQDGTTLYEISGSAHHDHIVCIDCGEIFEFFDPIIEKAQEKLEKKLEFKGVSHRHVIYANCRFGTNKE